MSAQIRRKNDRSKLVEQEYGRRLYASDLPYEEAMDQLSQKYLDSVKLIKQSEFKKPYLEDDYVPMEYAYYPTDWPTFAPVNPGDSITPDCKVGIEASGVLDAWRDCVNPEEDCSAWIFTCAHKLTQIMCGYCTIKKMTPLGILSDGITARMRRDQAPSARRVPSLPAEIVRYRICLVGRILIVKRRRRGRHNEFRCALRNQRRSRRRYHSVTRS